MSPTLNEEGIMIIGNITDNSFVHDRNMTPLLVEAVETIVNGWISHQDDGCPELYVKMIGLEITVSPPHRPREADTIGVLPWRVIPMVPNMVLDAIASGADTSAVIVDGFESEVIEFRNELRKKLDEF